MMKELSFRMFGAMSVAALLGACAAQTPGPSVPFRAGATLEGARAAFSSCRDDAVQSGNATLTGHYLGSVLWGGVVVGPIIVASNAPALRYNGEVSGMDRCMETQGFVRRDLTAAEVRALNAADRATRLQMLDHLVSGGTLANFARG